MNRDQLVPIRNSGDTAALRKSIFVNLLAFGLALYGAALVVAWRLDPLDPIRLQREFLLRTPDINQLYAGSSLTAWNLDIATIDALQKEKGIEANSVSAAVEGYDMIAIGRMLDSLVRDVYSGRHPNTSLDTVIVEGLVTPHNTPPKDDVARSRRYRWVYSDLISVLEYLRSTAAWEMPDQNKITPIADTIKLFLETYLFLKPVTGCLITQPVASLENVNFDYRAKYPIEQYRGFTPPWPDPDANDSFMDKFNINGSRWDDMMRQFLRVVDRPPLPDRSIDPQVLERPFELAREFKFNLVVLIPPSVGPSGMTAHYESLIARYQGQGVNCGLINLNNPLKYPELFDYDTRRDPTHLSQKGTWRLSPILARELNTRLNAWNR